MAVKKFIDYLLFEKKYSNHTAVAYKKDIEMFESFLSKKFPLVKDKTNLIVFVSLQYANPTAFGWKNQRLTIDFPNGRLYPTHHQIPTI